MKTKLTILLFLTVSCYLTAQFSYDFNVSSKPYNDLVEGTSLNNGQIWDDPGYAVPIGFDFQIGPYIFNTIYIVDWSVGGVLSSKANDVGVASLLSPIAQDIIDLGFWGGASQSNLSYKTEGTIGNQILKIEWNNAGFVGSGSPNTDFMNFQVWFYEGSNIIEYRYGSSEINFPEDSFEGESGPIVFFIPSINIETEMLEGEDAYFLSGDPSSPTVIVVEPGNEPQEPIESLQGMIPDGTVYTFTPKDLSVGNFETIDFAVYPNPAGDYFNIRTNALEYQINIYNNLGQQVKHFDNSSTQIDVTGLPAGLYLIEVETERGSLIKKLIKK